MSVGRHTAYNFIGSVLPILLSLVTVPVYLRLVGGERYGVLSIAWLLLGYFGLFDLGLGRATSFRISALRDAPPEARARTFWAAVWVNAAMGLVGGVILFGVSAAFFAFVLKVGPALRTEMIHASPILSLAVPVATLTGVLTGGLQGRERFLQINVVSTLSTALFQLLPLAVAWLNGPNLSGILISAVAARLVAGVVMAYFCHREITSGQPARFDRSEAIALLKYGGWVNVTSAISPVLFMTDRFMIGGVLGAQAVTDYTVPYQLANRTAIMPGALTTALFPRMSSISPEQQRRLAEQAILAVACLLSPLFIGGIFIMGPFLALWVGDQIGPAGPVVGRILLLAMWANALALVSFTRLQASGRPDTVSKIMLAEIAPYLLLLGGGAALFGLIGCALATAARSILDCVLLTWFAERRLPAWRLVGGQLALVGLAAWLAGLWTIGDWRWWAAAAALIAASASIAALSIPAELRTRMFERLPGLGLRPR